MRRSWLPTSARADMLEVSDLYVAYGNVLALHGATLQVRTGEAVAVIGSNGAG